VSKALHLDFAVGVCLAHVASAEIGLRRYRDARTSIRRLEEVADAQEDPYLRIAQHIVSLKYALATGSPGSWIAHEQAPIESFARATYAEYIALCALAAGARGDSERAHDLIRSARRRSRAVEPSFLTHFAALVSDLELDVPEAAVTPRLASVIEDAARAECLDVIVIAYRAYPRLLSLFTDPYTNANAALALEAAVRSGRDEEAARRAGMLWIGGTTARIRNLTPRELEVLELLCEGLSNAEISRRLVISGSTTKVHIHRVLRKLGVTTRLEAAVHGRELLDATR
jgi:ATP/maltotriose-dependent transcriptional regulator MalT